MKKINIKSLNWKKVIKYGILATFIVSILTFFMTFLLPSPVLGKTNSIKIYDTYGSLSFELLKDKESEYVEIEKINPHFINAIIAVEDKTFYDHNGINFERILKSMYVNLMNQDLSQGGSTLTQQYVKNVYYTNDKNYARKFKEIIMALRIENFFSKDMIMENYLNTLYFGHGIFGIENASKYFFNVSNVELNIPQCALLAAIINAPGIYSPFIHYDKSVERTQLILKEMLKENFITSEQYYEYYSYPFEFSTPKAKENNLSLYYRDSVLSEMKSLGFYKDEFLLKGLQVETYLDPQIIQILDKVTKSISFAESSQVAISVMKPYSGEVLGVIGGKNYDENTFNRSINASRQIGSTIKPLIYYLSLLNHLTPSTTLMSEETTFFIKGYGQYAPGNNNDTYANRPINMAEAIATSDNIYAVKNALLVGSQNIINSLKEFSIEASTTPSVALGTIETSPLKLNSIYNTFASEGKYYSPKFIKRITDSKGRVLYTDKKRSKNLMGKDQTIVLNQLLRAPFDLNMKSYSTPTLVNYQTKNRYAAKTGLTKSDAWVAAYNPNISFTVWVGNDDGLTIEQPSDAKKVFQNLAREFDRINENSWYLPTNKISAKKVNPITMTNDSKGSIYYFMK